MIDQAADYEDGYDIGQVVWITVFREQVDGSLLEYARVLAEVCGPCLRQGVRKLGANTGQMDRPLGYSVYGQQVRLLQDIPGTAIERDSMMFPALVNMRPARAEGSE